MRANLALATKLWRGVYFTGRAACMVFFRIICLEDGIQWLHCPDISPLSKHSSTLRLPWCL